MRFAFISLAFALLCGAASAHHSFGSFYSRDQDVEIVGELTRLRWRNPHARFWIQADDGEIWEIETNTLGMLERHGITRNLFTEGDRIRVAGNPSRTDENSIYAHNILLPDGREVLTGRGATRRWSDRLIDFEERELISEAAANAAKARADGIFRVWSRLGAGFPEKNFYFTEDAMAAAALWDPLRDDPTLRCIAPGMIGAMDSPSPIEFLREGNDIVLRLEEWAQTRYIHMNQESVSATTAATPLGYSAGRWEDDALVISTNRISWPHFDNHGIPQSGEVEMVERFRLSEDENSMMWEITVTDEVNLSEPAVMRQPYLWVPGEQIKEFDCVLAEEVE